MWFLLPLVGFGRCDVVSCDFHSCVWVGII